MLIMYLYAKIVKISILYNTFSLFSFQGEANFWSGIISKHI